jgi:hypothetical protein
MNSATWKTHPVPRRIGLRLPGPISDSGRVARRTLAPAMAVSTAIAGVFLPALSPVRNSS